MFASCNHERFKFRRHFSFKPEKTRLFLHREKCKNVFADVITGEETVNSLVCNDLPNRSMTGSGSALGVEEVSAAGAGIGAEKESEKQRQTDKLD